ncbi:hypothetical protein [Tropicimonas sp. IMCC6043]|uniref:hypothetical protein n=1 Tax=Tropicimonas sp. IMCC6043 TaxID=2510645 RepID=UPI00101C91EA|nr:hypothetical protein [Tropicimonas sp. IMCC6043]RYH07381.1 hypothetical protein EU800_20565 [Tropicimonas sp. IMCC6043]
MSHVIVRGANIRRHEVDFGDDEISVSAHAGSETVGLANDASHENRPEGRHRIALMNILRHIFSETIAELAKNTRVL